MGTVLEISNLGKQYQLGEIGLKNFSLKKDDPRNFWALENLNISINKGEVLGIIGENGAGKSTLLKLLSQITKPTTGRIRARGRIASLLEVGTGMHPDLTGRENIFLNGAILGMSKSDIKTKFDDIVAFSGCEKFIDTPFKRFSSGMKVRLGFSVAVHLDPDILIIDEVLAVGDVEFQAKAIAKIVELTSDAKRTVLFVSHNLAAVKSLCSRCLYLKDGQVEYDGDTDTAISKYLGYEIGEGETNRDWSEAEAPGNEFVKLRAARLLIAGQEISEPLTTEKEVELVFEINNLKGLNLDCTIQLFSMQGEFIAATSTMQAGDDENHSARFIRFLVDIPANVFNQRSYRINVLFVRDKQSVVYRFDDVLQLNYIGASRPANQWMGEIKSHLLPKLPWTVSEVD